AEFEVMVTGPEGTSVASMDEAMRAVTEEIRSTPGVRTVLTTVGGGFLEAVNFGRAYVLLEPHEKRVFSLTRFLGGLARLDPGAAFRGNASQRDVMQEIRRR